MKFKLSNKGKMYKNLIKKEDFYATDNCYLNNLIFDNKFFNSIISITLPDDMFIIEKIDYENEIATLIPLFRVSYLSNKNINIICFDKKTEGIYIQFFRSFKINNDMVAYRHSYDDVHFELPLCFLTLSNNYYCNYERITLYEKRDKHYFEFLKQEVNNIKEQTYNYLLKNGFIL